MALIANSAWAISTRILESPDVCKDEGSDSKELIKEQEAVDARYDVDSCDQR